jgi:uridine kinase
LEAVLRGRGQPVIRASVDGFHRPRAERYRLGPDSPEGYYFDSFDAPAILEGLLLPLGPGGGQRIRLASFDYRQDASLPAEWQAVPREAILLFDGVFLLRPELNPHWDFRIFVKICFETSVERGCRRDLPYAEPGAMEALRRRYWQRYVAGQQIYLRSVRPETLADVIFDNEDLDHPRLIQQGWTG